MRTVGDLVVSKAVRHVIVHHADRLHECIADGRSHKVESALFQILAHHLGHLRLRRHIRNAFPCVLDGNAVHLAPQIRVERTIRLLDIENPLRILDGRFDLEAIPYDAGISHETGNIVWRVSRDALTVKRMQRLSVVFPFFQYCQPTQTRLCAFQNQEFKQASVVMNRATPFVVMIGNV